MAIIQLPLQLRKFVNYQDSIQIPGDSLMDIINNITLTYPDLKPYLVDNSNNIYHFINLYLNGQDIRFLEDNQKKIKENDIIIVIPAIAGG